jgi:hypothetical protein
VKTFTGNTVTLEDDPSNTIDNVKVCVCVRVRLYTVYCIVSRFQLMLHLLSLVVGLWSVSEEGKYRCEFAPLTAMLTRLFKPFVTLPLLFLLLCAGDVDLKVYPL